MAEEIISKTCSACKIDKPLSEFYKEPRNRSGLASQCKQCHYRKCREYIKTEKGALVNRLAKRKYKKSAKGQASEKRYRQTEKRKQVKLKYNRSLKGRIQARKSAKRMQKKYPEKIKACNAVNHYVRMGYIPSPKTLQCACGNPAHDYHHHLGYEKTHWLDVIPICTLCHKHIA